jgi:hypothetical protein
VTRSCQGVRTFSCAFIKHPLCYTNTAIKYQKIASYPEENPSLVREIVTSKNAKSHAISAFKMAMMILTKTCFKYIQLVNWGKSFKNFHQVFIPLLNELWQTDTISPAHEHFVSYLIKQKLLVNSEKLQQLERTKKIRFCFVSSYEWNSRIGIDVFALWNCIERL